VLELYQFELSQYSEKVRLILDYKGLEYKKKEVTPGIGQLELFRLSGSKQVPVLKDGDLYISDSTEIAFYLDRKYPENPIVPEETYLKGQCANGRMG
jgi:glutathione S-transferase